MSEELINSVQAMLKEETWTRATISNYTINNIKELANLLEKAKSEACTKEINEICTEHLSHTKDSIIALYLSGMISIEQKTLDNSNLITLVDIFEKNHKEPVVEYLCQSILEDDPDNKFAIRTLAHLYQSENKPEVWDLYEKLVKIDYSEAEICKILAEHYEAESDSKKAVEYYKKAILRYVNAKNMTAIKELWTKLISIIPLEIDFFELVKRKIAKTIGDDKTLTLIQELYNWYKDNKKWETAISLIKEILTLDSQDNWARKEIVECYREYYKNHSNLDEYIRASNLTQSYRDIFQAINDFEKHISFDVKHFVFHRNWGVGKITKVQNNELTINFGKKAGIHTMTLKMAVSALTPLAKDHIWVLKATNSREDLNKRVKNDKVETLKIIIKSFDNNCDFKKIKAELVPSILTQGEWTSWNAAAKKELDTNPIFGVNPNDISMYTVRENKITPEEKLSNEFKAQKQFFERICILMKFIENEETDKSSDLFAEMYSYFTAYLKNITKVNEEVLASYLIVQKLSSLDKMFAFPVKYTFSDIFNKIENPREMYELLKDKKNTTLREDFLSAIKKLTDWDDIYINMFPTVLKEKLIDELIKDGKEEKVKKMVIKCFENYRDYRNAVLFLFEKCRTKDWFVNSGISYEKQLITLINIIELTFFEITNHTNTTENKKINKNATKLLFEDGHLVKYMFEDDNIETVKRMYTLIDDIQDLEPDYKFSLRNKILEKYPSFKFHTSEEKPLTPKGVFVTAKKLKEKQQTAFNIQNVELPANAKEIAEAREQGDLKENAEYKAAKEHQHKLNVDLAKLQEELGKAIVFNPASITTAIVSFGTKVVLHNNDTNTDDTFTILGPWESDPDNGVLSYMSPLGNAILNLKQGESKEFYINGKKKNYTVVSITAAEF